jgi:hypothetical protein
MALVTTLRSRARAIARLVRREAPWFWFAVFALAVSYQYATPTPERGPLCRPEAHGDGLYEYAYYRSIVFDHDVELANDYRLLRAPVEAGADPATQRAPNVFPPGAALFWLAFAPVAHAGQALAEWAGAPAQTLVGTESLYQRSVLYGSVVAGLITVMLVLSLARRITSAGLATLAAIGLCLGSPLIWCMLRQPSFAYAVDACVVALFASGWLITFGSRARVRWLGMGALLGIAMMVRPQNVAHALLPLGEWLWLTVPLVRQRAWRELGKDLQRGLCFVLAVLLTIAPLLLLRTEMHGTWTLLPQRRDLLYWNDSRWAGSLFSSRGGLFAYYPLLLVSTMGLVVLALSSRHSHALRMFAVSGLSVLAMQAYVHGAAKEWWDGSSLGGGRHLSCTLYFGAGLAVMLELARSWVTRHAHGFVQLAAGAAIVAFALHNRSLIDDNLQGRMPPDLAQPFKPRYAGTLHKTLDELYAWSGNPGSWPANLWFAGRAGTSPERYDLAAGNDFFDLELVQGRRFSFDDWHAFRGFGPASQFAGQPARKVEQSEATWLFMLRSRSELVGELMLGSPHRRAMVDMYLGDTKIMHATLKRGWHRYTFEIPRAETSTGANYVRVVQRLPKRKSAFVAYGEGNLRSVRLPSASQTARLQGPSSAAAE